MKPNKTTQVLMILAVIALYMISIVAGVAAVAGTLAAIWTGDMRYLWSAIVLLVVAALTGGAATKE